MCISIDMSFYPLALYHDFSKYVRALTQMSDSLIMQGLGVRTQAAQNVLTHNVADKMRCTLCAGTDAAVNQLLECVFISICQNSACGERMDISMRGEE